MTLLLDALIRSTVLLAAGLGAVALLRRQSAALRHWILAASMAAAALATPLAWILPDWSIAAVPAPAIPVFEAVAPEPALPQAPGVSLQPVRAVAGPAVPQPAWPGWLLLIWGAGAAIGVLSIAAQVAGLARLSARASRVSGGRWPAAVSTVAAQYGIRQQVSVLQPRTADLLATWGLTRHRILVPAGASRWSDERIEIVVRHELAHVRRNDWLLQVAADLVRRLYWFQPLMWIACRQLRRESEHACDDVVLETGIAPDAYAGHLLQIARAGRSRFGWVPAVPMARPSTLERRISAMLNAARNRSPLSFRSLMMSTLLLAVATVTAAAFHPEQGGGGTLVGTVYDRSGGVMPGVEVALLDARQGKSTATTDAAGKFQFPGTAAGKYVLELSLPGFNAFREELQLKDAGDWDRAITLQIGQLRETISVRAKREIATQPTPGLPKPTPVRVGGNIKAPTKLVNVNPVYPMSMRVAGRSGVVPVDAVIGTDGSVVLARVVSANIHPDFAEAALEAVRQWKFSPTLLNGKPVEVAMAITISFSLE